MSVDNVADIEPFVQYVATSSQTAFTYPFPIFEDADLLVYVNDTLMTLTTDYTVSGEGGDNGGTVTFVTGRTAGQVITIARDVAMERTTDFAQNGPRRSADINDELDRMTMYMQQLKRDLNRAVRIALTNAQDGDDLVLDGAFEEKYLYVNSDGELEPAAALATTTLTQSVIGELLYPAGNAAEAAAGVTPVNHAYNYGTINRYGTNTTPGTTDMTTAIQAALDVAHNGVGVVRALAQTYLTGQINWPGNNLSLIGEGSAYSYNTSAAPKTVFKAKAATSIVFDLVQTGLAEDRTGNHLADFDVDGNAIAVVGIDVAGSNIIERVRVKGCTTAGVRLSNFTNGTRIVRCGLNSNSGWGLQVEGASTTTFSVTDTNTSLNTAGGIDLQAGVLVNFKNVISESNTGPGLRIYKPNTHTNTMEGFTFDNCWFEDNASASPYFTLVIDAGTSSPTTGANRIKFNKCRFTASAVTRKYANILVGKWISFEDCQFDNSTEANAITGGSNAHHVSFINCTQAVGPTGITATQMDNAIAQGTYWWWHDPGVQRLVGGSSPAAAFTNSWVNYDGGFATAKYWFDRDGHVCIEGSVKTGSAGTSVFTLPTGYRPAAQMAFAVDANGSHGLVYVNTNGTVVVNAGSSTITSLNGIRFQRAVA